ncbi:hypothetical protein WR25_24510 [Diploscapter pachys]|uniref:Decapping nuclease n=1 Tax=Diploscapter pachys TaxID=2018661 RepID=A0A2A2L7W8_9BILA|nr:hypothetical protein WR25_24510 [Diploscapter pachys]
MADGFWLFEGLEDEPYGLLPLVNLSGKGGPTSTKYVDRIGSYQWFLNDETPTIIVPGQPTESFFWPGGKLMQDHGVVIYDVNHMKVKNGSLDPLIIAARLLSEKKKKPIDFSQYHFITDAVNLQKIFAFAQEAGDGLFRIDCERVGDTVLFSRMEASDLMEIGHVTFDYTLKARMTRPRSIHTTGPFFQLIGYQFGNFRILVRFEVDCADYAAAKVAAVSVDKEEAPPAKEKSDLNPDIEIAKYGEVLPDVPLQLLTTYPQGAGFPFFTWAQLFFTNANQEVVGFFKGNGDFGKPALYNLQDISKMMKPLPYVTLSKVHDCLDKIHKFLTKNRPDFRCGLVWKGKNHLEIFAKHEDADGGISKGVRDFLATQCKDKTDDEAGAS